MWMKDIRTLWQLATSTGDGNSLGYTVQHHGEVLLPSSELLITVDQKPTVNLSDGSIENLTKSCRLIQEMKYGRLYKGIVPEYI